MSLTKMAPGAWRYYAEEIASGREDYFAEGHQRGVWLGRGASVLGIDGAQVTPEELERLFGMGLDPISGASLGLAFDQKNAHTVAGFALTFSPPKSVSVLWAVSEAHIGEEVVAAQEAAMRAALGFLEEHAAFTRRGRGGVYQVDTSGYLAAAFTHRTSRSGDPQLHTHVLVANKVQAAEGSWLSIDARELYEHQKAAGMLYKAALRAEMTTRLGVAWTPVDENGIAEVVGVPDRLAEAWSSRREELERVAVDIVANREASLGRTLTADERADAFQIAAYQTRAPKLTGSEDTASLKARWSEEADAYGHPAESWVNNVLARQTTAEIERSVYVDPKAVEGEIIRDTVHRLHMTSATWGRSDAVEVLSTLVDDRDADAVRARIEALADRVLADHEIVMLRVPLPVEPPAGLRRRDGLAFIERHGATRFTTKTTLAQEAAVLDMAERGRDAQVAVVDPWRVDRLLAQSVLGDDQRDAIRALVTGGEQIAILVGPPGAGKTRAIDLARVAWEEQGDDPFGLTTSARAVAVLSEEANLRADTIAKFIWEQQHGAPPLTSRSVVIVDESSMAATQDLARIATYVQQAGAKLVLVGDPYQLGAVGPGGLFATLVGDEAQRGRVSELETIRRFTHAWERAATLQLRAGDPSVLDAYAAEDRISGGTREEILDRAFGLWRLARDHGHAIVVMAGDNATVEELARRARADRVLRGEVEATGVETATVGRGDEIVTLRNNRKLRTESDEWVRNGDRWEVLDRRGATLLVRSLDGHGTVELPAEYVREHVALAYALTIHKAQGMTVDLGVVIADDRMTSEQLLVGMTRGRAANAALVIADKLDPDHGQHTQRDALDVLRSVLARHGADRSAHDVMREEFGRYDDVRFQRDVGEEARRRIDLLAGPDRREEIDKIEGTVDLDPVRDEYASRAAKAEEDTHRRETAEAYLADLRPRAEGDPAVDHDEFRRVEEHVAFIKRQERDSLRSYEKARYDLYEAEQRVGDLAMLREEQAVRDAWLDRHPEERAWLREFVDATSDRETLRTSTLPVPEGEPSVEDAPRRSLRFLEHDSGDYWGGPTAEEMGFGPGVRGPGVEYLDIDAAEMGGPEIVP